jgi:hypothetical protein
MPGRSHVSERVTADTAQELAFEPLRYTRGISEIPPAESIAIKRAKAMAKELKE